MAWLETYDWSKEEEEQIICRWCKISKPENEYTPSNKKYCKQCVSEKNRKYHLKNKERINAYKREYMKNVFKVSHPDYKKQYNSKRIKTDVEYNKKMREKRREYVRNNYATIKEKRKERDKLKWYNAIQLRAKRLIKKLWIRPNKCPICWFCSDIVAHHPDYSKRYEIVFCCKSCHNFIHNWTMECPQPIDILHYKD